MNSEKENAALPRSEQAANRKTTRSHDSSDDGEIIAVIEKNDFEEMQVRLNEYRDELYLDIRMWAIFPHKRVPTKKGLSISLRTLPKLIQALEQAARLSGHGEV
jgi:hypothetical protein